MIRRFVAIALGGGALAWGAGHAFAADACISPSVSEKLNACTGLPSQRATSKPPVKLISPPSTAKPSVPPPEPKNVDAKEIRRKLASVRSFELLVAEVQELESLVSVTPATSPDRPSLLRRLADSYVELESASFARKIETGIKVDEAKRAKKNADALVAVATKADRTMAAARQAAIRYFTELKTRHPKWCQHPDPRDPTESRGCVDEVLYNLAYEHEQANDLERARQVYFELIQSAPKSKYVPNAYLAFGELFFQEAQADASKWALAEQSYREVIKYPAPANASFGYAHYKLGYVYWNKGDLAQALGEFKKTIENGLQYPEIANAKPLAVAARRDIVPVYAGAGDGKKAFDFFHPLSGDKAGSNEETFKMLDALGQSYLDTGHYGEAIALYQDLMGRDKGARRCGYQTHITEAVIATKSGDKDAIVSALSKQLDFERQFKADSQPSDAKQACANSTALIATETAMAWHLEAQGSEGVRGTVSPKTMDLAADLYAKVVRRFSKEEFASFEFPRVVKEDWPTLLKVKYAMADLLYFRRAWDKCGPAFDAVFAEEPRGPLAAEALHASAICYQSDYLNEHGAPSKSAERSRGAAQRAEIAPKELSEKQRNMLTAFSRFVCVYKADKADKAQVEQLAEVKFAIAQTYFDAFHWEEAAIGFREIALANPNEDVGATAADLYLEALNVMATKVTPARSTCIEQMAEDVPKISAAQCANGSRSNPMCDRLGRVGRQVERAVLDRLAKSADGSPNSLKIFEQAGEGYFALWTKYGKDACENKTSACEQMDEVLHNAANAYQRAHLLAKAIAVRKVLVDPRFHLDSTEPARKAVYDVGANYQAIATYDEAATWYERFARENSKRAVADGGVASRALEDATVLRLGLGNEDAAIKDAELFAKAFGNKQPALSAQIGFALGAHYAEHEEWDKAKKALAAAMPKIDAHAPIDIVLQAHAAYGRSLWRTGGTTAAAAEFEKVRAQGRDSDAVLKKLSQPDLSDDERAHRLGKALLATGEALFFFAEQKRKDVDRMTFPYYTGSGRRDDVLRHINTKVLDWIKRKRPAIEEAERAYLKILDLKPVPPKWAIAAGSRTGQMWGRFVAEFRAAPTPRQWKQAGWEDVLGAYTEGIDGASELQKQRAKAAFVTCLSYAVRFQYSDENSRRCEEWLSKNYAAEFHLVDEFKSGPAFVATLVDRSSPMLLRP